MNFENRRFSFSRGKRHASDRDKATTLRFLYTTSYVAKYEDRSTLINVPFLSPNITKQWRKNT